jgi:hypothetical protein
MSAGIIVAMFLSLANALRQADGSRPLEMVDVAEKHFEVHQPSSGAERRGDQKSGVVSKHNFHGDEASSSLSQISTNTSINTSVWQNCYCFLSYHAGSDGVQSDDGIFNEAFAYTKFWFSLLRGDNCNPYCQEKYDEQQLAKSGHAVLSCTTETCEGTCTNIRTKSKCNEDETQNRHISCFTEKKKGEPGYFTDRRRRVESMCGEYTRRVSRLEGQRGAQNLTKVKAMTHENVAGIDALAEEVEKRFEKLEGRVQRLEDNK